MAATETIVGIFAIVGTLVGAGIGHLSAWHLDARRRHDDAQAERRAAIEAFLASARTCIQNIAAAHGAHDLAREADRSWRLGNRRALSQRALRLMDMGTIDSLPDLVAVRLGVDRLRMTWGEHEVVARAAEARDRIHDAAVNAAENKDASLSADVRFVNDRLDAVASIAYTTTNG